MALDHIWIIPAYIEHEQDHLMLRNCVQSIYKFFGNSSHILVVDSDSPYQAHVTEFNVATIKNKHYEAGALYYGVTQFDAKYYTLLHDSSEVINNFSFVYERPLTIGYKLNSWDLTTASQQAWVKDKINTTGWAPGINQFNAVLGAIMTIKYDVIHDILNKGLLNLYPTTKDESMGYERLIGMVLTMEGYGSYMTDVQLFDSHIKKISRGRQ